MVLASAGGVAFAVSGDGFRPEANKALTEVIATASNNHLGAARAQQWITAATLAVELYAEHPTVAFTDLAADIATEVRLLRAVEAELAEHATAREDAYRWTDPSRLARTLPGIPPSAARRSPR